VKLNLGCGDRYVDGWVNVDNETPHRIDQRRDLRKGIPEEWAGQVTHIYAGHLFEHLTPYECERLASGLIVCAHTDGCVFVAVGPDIAVAEQMVKDGTFDFTYHSLDTLRHGAGRWSGDEHMWETTGPAVAKIIRDAGWPVVHVMTINQLEGGWPVADPTQLWQYAVRAWIGPVDPLVNDVVVDPDGTRDQPHPGEYLGKNVSDGFCRRCGRDLCHPLHGGEVL